MKTRRTIIMILTLCVALSFTACTGKGDVGKADSSSVSKGTEKTEDLQAKLDDLYQQENEIFENIKMSGKKYLVRCPKQMPARIIMPNTLLLQWNQTKTLLRMMN